MITHVFHIVQLPHGWQIKTVGPSSTFQSFPSAQEAVTAARSLASAHPPSQVRVHSLSGKLLAEWTYNPAPARAAMPAEESPSAVGETQAAAHELVAASA